MWGAGHDFAEPAHHAAAPRLQPVPAAGECAQAAAQTRLEAGERRAEALLEPQVQTARLADPVKRRQAVQRGRPQRLKLKSLRPLRLLSIAKSAHRLQHRRNQGSERAVHAPSGQQSHEAAV